MLVLKNISKSYNKPVLSHFSYVFKKSTIYCIIGKSGCGKSTLLSLLSNNDKNYLGNIYFNNKDIRKLKNYTFQDVGYVYQNYQLFDSLTVKENIYLPLELASIDTDKYKFRLEVLLEHFQIKHLKDNKVKDLSGGEKQRVALIRMLLKDPKIILLDEPTSALDEYNSKILFDYLTKIKENKIIIIVTHNLQIAEMADKIIDFNHLENKKHNVLEVKHKEEIIKFEKTNELHKKVFANKKIFNYLASSILTFGIVCLGISFIIYFFINSVVNNSFSMFKLENCVTFKAINDGNIVDFSKERFPYETIYYEGLESSLKTNIKNSNIISSLEINDYKLADVNMIFDNYLSSYSENIVLYVPEYLERIIQEDNHIYVYYDDIKQKIKIDKIYFSDDNNFYIYCNNYSYLDPFFKHFNIKKELSSYLYCKQTNKLFDYLNSQTKYQNYLFLIDSSNYIIKINQNGFSRISDDSLKMILNNDNNGYLLSDYYHTYIDYNNGFLYLLDKNKVIQVVIDDNLDDNVINVSKRLELDDNQNIFEIFDKSFTILNITDENNYSLIYMNKTTFNSLNDNICYCGILYFKNDNIIKDDNIIINKHLFASSSFKVFDYISLLLLAVALIISIFAIIAFIVVFNINLLNKEKDIKTLYKLGMYRKNIIFILILDPLKNIISSIFSGLISIIMSVYLIKYIYMNINHSPLDINIPAYLYLIIIVFPFATIIPLIFLKMKRNITI